MPDINDAADEMLEHSDDEGEWADEPERIEVRPSGSQVISTRLPTALAERLFAEAQNRGIKLSELVRLAVERLLLPEAPSDHRAVSEPINAFVGPRLTLVTPSWPYRQFRTENANTVVEPDGVPEPPLVVGLGYPASA